MNSTSSTQITRPILFSAPMVRAILDGCKTQTRRIAATKGYGGREFIGRNISGKRRAYSFEREMDRAAMLNECPYGSVGDRLWVRETFCICNQKHRTVVYRATNENHGAYPWRPSIHMPRWASRITLEITKVRVERLQEISYEDVVAEGIKMLGIGLSADVAHLRPQFRQLWDQINGEGAWDKNSWVWVIEFRPVAPSVGAAPKSDGGSEYPQTSPQIPLVEDKEGVKE